MATPEQLRLRVGDKILFDILYTKAAKDSKQKRITEPKFAGEYEVTEVFNDGSIAAEFAVGRRKPFGSRERDKVIISPDEDVILSRRKLKG